MATLALTGLVGSHPLGAMAAFGLLRIISKCPAISTPRLSWGLRDDWIATLQTCADDEESLRHRMLTMLVNRQRRRHRRAARVLSWSDDVKTEPCRYSQWLADRRAESRIKSREAVDFLAAFGCDVITAPSTGDVKPTAFHMTAGQQKFLKSARELAISLSPDRPRRRRQTASEIRRECIAAFERALFGPWRYQDSEHSLGWDPSTEALHALSHIAPTAAGPTSEAAAVWLAFESLPLFPTAPTGRRLYTRGFDPRGDCFTWPIWQPPISVDTLASLLGLAVLTASRPPFDQLSEMGITAVYRAVCQRDANGRGTFRHARLVAGGSTTSQEHFFMAADRDSTRRL
jgi:hypothetical protein